MSSVWQSLVRSEAKYKEDTEFHQTHHITYFKHAEYEYQGGFSIKQVVFVWEAFEDDIVFCVMLVDSREGAVINHIARAV